MRQWHSSSPQMKQRVVLVQISAIIGVGKSSLLYRLERTGALHDALDGKFDVRFVQEPIDEWHAMGVLDEFYRDPGHCAAAFQLIAFTTHVDAVERALAAPSTRPILLVTDRGMADQALFWDVQVDAGHPSADCIHQMAYKRVWDKWARFVPPTSLIVLLQTSDVQITMRRLQGREGSAMERPDGTVDSVGGITADYQQRLHDKHCEWFETPLARPPCYGPHAAPIPCLHINVDAPIHANDEALRRVVDELAGAIRAIE